MTSSAICDRFGEVAARDRDRTAIFAPAEKQHRTFGQLWDDYKAVAAALDGLTLPPGGPCVSIVGNASGFVPLVLACLEGRRPLVLLDGGASSSQAGDAAHRFGACAIVGTVDDMTSFPDPTSLPAGLAATILDDPANGSLDPATAVLKMTSGSSAVPKGVQVTDQALINDGSHIIEAMNLRPHDVNLAVIPLAHSYGFGNLVMPLLLQGSSMVLRPQFDARQLLADIDAFNATVLPAVPFIFDYLVRLESAPSPLSRLHLAITAGAPITFEVIRAYAERFSRKIHAFYGTSETGGIAYDDSAELDTAVPVGRPMPETSVSLVAQPGRPGDEGRVHVVGNALGLGYASADDEPEPGAFVDGGFLTGDLARRDREGRLVLTGRVSRFVNVAGRKVHPEEVERVIGQATGVDDVLVLGVPWPARGEVMVACVRCPEPRMTAESLRLHCSERLPPYKVPRSFLFLESFPVDARGKIDRDALARLAAGTTLRDR